MIGAGIIKNMFFEFRRRFAKNICSYTRRKITFAAVIRITAPSVFEQIFMSLFRVPQSTRPPISRTLKIIEWVEMNVVENVQEKSIRVYVNFLRPTLEKVAATIVSIIKILRVPNIQFSDECRDPTFTAWRQKQVVVIFHQTPRMYIDESIITITTYDVVIFFFQEICCVIRRGRGIEQEKTVNKTKPIPVVEKNISLFDAPIDQMVEFHARKYTITTFDVVIDDGSGKAYTFRSWLIVGQT